MHKVPSSKGKIETEYEGMGNMTWNNNVYIHKVEEDVSQGGN